MYKKNMRQKLPSLGKEPDIQIEAVQGTLANFNPRKSTPSPTSIIIKLPKVKGKS